MRPQRTIVMKAGGVVVGRQTSLATLADIVGGYRKVGDRVALVVSAPDRATDLLKAVATAKSGEVTRTLSASPRLAG